MKKSIQVLMSTGVILLAVAFMASGTIIPLDFDEGLGTASVDQYEGVAGDGWQGAWIKGGIGTPAVTVTNTSPIDGGGNYLNATMTASGTQGFQLIRQFDGSASGVDVTKDHRITFNFRPDDYDGPGYLSIFAYSQPSSGTGALQSWAIGATGTVNARRWNLQNGDRAGSATSTDTGMAITDGTVYSFTVDVDADTKSWTVSIDNGTTTYNSGVQGFRTAADYSGTYLHFGAISVPDGDSVGFSVDSIGVTTIPEPGSISLVVVAGALIVAVRRRIGGYK